jgi:zinc protease
MWLWALAARGAELAEQVPFEVWTDQLDNGLSVWVNPRPESGSFVAAVTLLAGSRFEPDGQGGVSHLVEHLALTGTTALPSEEQVARFVAGRGGYRNAFTLQERMWYYVQLPSESLDDGLFWLSEVVFAPTLAASKIDKEREVVLAELGGREPWLVGLARQKLNLASPREHVFGLWYPGSGLESPVGGDLAELPGITPEQVERYHARRFRPEAALLVVAGDVDVARVGTSAERYFGGLKGSNEPFSLPKLDPSRPPSAVVEGMEQRLSDTCSVVLTAPGPGRDDPDLWALDVLGEYLADELWDELRISRGLVYRLQSGSYFHAKNGAFQVQTEVDCRNRLEVVDAMSEAVNRVLQGRVDAERLARVRTTYVGQWRIRMESNLDRVEWLSRWFGASERPLEHAGGVVQVASLTPARLAEVSLKWLAPERRAILVLIPVMERRALVQGMVFCVMAIALAGLLGSARRLRQQRQEGRR